MLTCLLQLVSDVSSLRAQQEAAVQTQGSSNIRNKGSSNIGNKGGVTLEIKGDTDREMTGSLCPVNHEGCNYQGVNKLYKG